VDSESAVDSVPADSDTFYMEVHLTPRQEAFIQRRVSAGHFATQDEAIQAAVALLEEREGLSVSNRPINRKNLAQLFAESPFRGLDMEFPRDKHLTRDMQL
jgi:putative addiction module CopG family antidote